MNLKKWDKLPQEMQVREVWPYYRCLQKKSFSLCIKRMMDIVLSLMLLFLLVPVFFAIAVMIRRDSKGPVFFSQERVTQYGRIFRMYKFRTMSVRAQRGTQVTLKNDRRITKVGKILRRYRLDELPQLVNILAGDMTFVGTRPEVPYYVKKYKRDMRATLLLPAGVTSEASIYFKDEEKLLESAESADQVYLTEILPEKMKYNLAQIKEFSIWKDIKILVYTVVKVAGFEKDCKNGWEMDNS